MDTYDRNGVELGADLSRALGYVAAWRGRRVVIKLGGRALEEERLGTVIEDIVLLQRAGLLPILVHGGGPEISETLERFGHEARFVDGLRVTDRATMEVVEMVLAGSVNTRVVRLVQQAGGEAVGLSGRDGGLLRVAPHPRRELGFVGEVVAVEEAVLGALLSAGFIPIVATLGLGPGGESYNVNADTAAASLAVAVRAEKLLVLTDVRGIRRPGPDGSEQLVSELAPETAAELVTTGVVQKGMIPKLEACLAAIAGGVPSAHIVGADLPHSLLVELFTDRGSGTMIRNEARAVGSSAPQTEPAS